MLRRTLVSACAGALLCLTAGAAGAASNFAADVNDAINRGLAYLDADGAFSGYPSCQGGSGVGTSGGYGALARGMPLLALLEKRASGNLSDAPQGYSGASDADKTRMRKAVSCILASVKSQTFESYYYGNWLMALSLYARTGGPGKGAADIPDDANLLGLAEAIDKMTDLTLKAQRTTPPQMWSYTGPGSDSSTTQFAAAGLAGAKAYYISIKDPNGFVPRINTALGNARVAYTDYARTGSNNGSCSIIELSEKGFSYSAGGTPSLQQTASGFWVQVLGGATINDNSVQAYVKWLRNHYRWQDLDNMYGGYPSTWYYMWSLMKGIVSIEESGTQPTVGKVSVNAIGTLAPDADPDPSDSYTGACPVRQMNKDPAAVARNSLYGAGGVGYYSGEKKSVYFDLATTIMSHQAANGSFSANDSPGSWGSDWLYPYGWEWDRSAWGLLVLQRATGGACADTDGNGICDSDEGDEEAPGDMLCDSNLDGQVTYSDLKDLYGLIVSNYPVAIPVTPQNAWANYNSTGLSASTIDINDFWQCYYVSRGKLPILYEGGGT